MLNRKVTVYVPGTVNGIEPAPALQAENALLVISQLSRWFGGATMTDATGAWVSDVHGLVLEPVKLVTSSTDAAGIAAHQDNLLQLGSYLAQVQGQEAVAIEIDGTMHFATQTDLKVAA
jgi:hypothetical protein